MAISSWNSVSKIYVLCMGYIVYQTGSMSTINPYRYCGYRFDERKGLYYLQSRYYNPKNSRFISSDGLMGSQGNILGHNMYAYTQNNPVMYTDYSGYLICGGLCIAGIIVGVGLIAGALEIGNQHTQYRNNDSQGEFSIDWGSVAIEAGYAMGVTSLTIFSAGSTSWGMNWYFYSRMGLATTYSIGRGLYDGKSALDIAVSTGIYLGLTATFVLVGNQPMSINLIDQVGNSGIGAFAILSLLQISRQSYRIVKDNSNTFKYNIGIDSVAIGTNYYRFD